MTEKAITDSIFSPDQVGQEALNTINSYQLDPGVKTGIEQLDSVMNPMRPGMRIPVLGYTSNWKSGFMDLVARNVGDQCKEGENVLFCTWEDSVDDIGIKNLAAYTKIPTTTMVRGELTDREWRKLREAAIARAQKPLWLVGASTSQYRKMQLPNMLDVWKMLEYLVDIQQIKPRLVILDYLQRITPHTQGDIRNQIIQILSTIYNMAVAFQVPVMFGVQAKREVMLRKWKQPQTFDALESSSIEHIASAFISLQMAIKGEPLNGTLDVAGKSFTVTENLLFIELLKQKTGPAPKLEAFNIDFDDNSLKPVYYQ